MKRVRKLPLWRRIAVAAWRPPNDPTIHGSMLVDMEKALEFIEEKRRESGQKITITHLVTKAVAQALATYPFLNQCVRGRYVYQRESVDIFLQVSFEKGEELSGVKLANADQKSVVEIAQELAQKAQQVRSHQDPQFRRTFSLLRHLPDWVFRFLLKLSDYVGNTLNWSIPSLGIVGDPFGSAMITSVGMWGIEVGYPPFFPYSRTALLVAVGEVALRPMVVDGQVVARRAMYLSATFDHRIFDGYQAAKLANFVKNYLEDPWQNSSFSAR
ncbi:MAG: 2-oxo acid dehydrogenase [Planctomycetota bacterium]|nr:MAG: 2-oxo acid dehydrogenase [Planctomycetota bacterium]